MARGAFQQRISRPGPQPQASIDTQAHHAWHALESGSALEQDEHATEDGEPGSSGALAPLAGIGGNFPPELARLWRFAHADGDISHMLDEAEVGRMRASGGPEHGVHQ